MRVAIGLRLAVDDWEAASTYVVEAERLGVDFVWSAEAWGHDAATPLAFLAGRTSRIRLGTGVMQVGTRSPALVAMTAMSLAAMSEGRFALGLGVSGPQVIEGWHGVPFERPVRRLRETVEIVRAALRGQRLVYRGHVYKIPLAAEGKALQSSARPQPGVPIYVAALTPHGLETAGEIADGWLGLSFMPEHRHVFLDHLETGAARAGRSLADLDLQAGGTVACTDDLERLLPPLKFALAYSLGAMGSSRRNFYNDAVRRAGYEDAALEVQRLWLQARWREAARRVPDELVLKTNLLGSDAMVRRRLEAYAAAGITTLRVDPAGETLDARLATLGRLLDLVRERREPASQPAALALTGTVPART
jgi:F420-dependent oxidoreductase-like protein